MRGSMYRYMLDDILYMYMYEATNEEWRITKNFR